MENMLPAHQISHAPVETTVGAPLSRLPTKKSYCQRTRPRDAPGIRVNQVQENL
jgi:hypothetical protein